MKQFKLTSALAAIVLAGCAASPDNGNANPPDGGSSGKRVPGIIDFYGEPVRVTVPGATEAGEPFAVTVVTYGGGCTEKGEATVMVEALRAEVSPYDYDTSAPQLDCDDMLRVYEHTVTVIFEETGTAEIVFLGQKEDSSGVTQTTVTRTLEVR